MEGKIKVSSDLSTKILTIGPDFRNHRGGVGAVIEVYSRYFEIFNFIPSYKVGSILYKCFVFILGLIKLFYTLLTNRVIKIIHIHGASQGSFYRKFIIFAIGKLIFRKKIIYHIHGGGFQKFYENTNSLSKLLIKTLLSQCDIVICLSQAWFEYFNQNFKIRAIKILPNIIDYPTIIKDIPKTDNITFLFLGLICDEKGIFDILKVIIKNKEHYKEKIKLLIGGNGETNRLKGLIEKHQIGDIVEFLGWISQEKKVDVLNKTDIYILPSYREGLPISILEAMSYGKAIISTNVGGIPEIVINIKNGLIIEPGNMEQLEQSLWFFLEHPELIKEYGALSEHMAQNYLPHAVVKKLSGIYETLLLNE
jgi:glycosyltransferase involved in cell wall biosynthesis